MPNLDLTGPMGEGPATGRGMGACNTQTNQAPQNFCRRGFGRGGGLGFCRRGFSNNNQVSLEGQEKILEKRLESVRELRKKSQSDQ